MVSTAPTNTIEGDWTWRPVEGQFGFKDGGQVILPVLFRVHWWSTFSGVACSTACNWHNCLYKNMFSRLSGHSFLKCMSYWLLGKHVFVRLHDFISSDILAGWPVTYYESNYTARTCSTSCLVGHAVIRLPCKLLHSSRNATELSMLLACCNLLTSCNRFVNLIKLQQAC